MTPPIPSLHLATEADAPTRIERIRQLKSEIAVLTREHVQHLLALMADAATVAQEIAGEDSFAPGIRDLARRYADEAQARSETIGAIAGRVGQ